MQPRHCDVLPARSLLLAADATLAPGPAPSSGLTRPQQNFLKTDSKHEKAVCLQGKKEKEKRPNKQKPKTKNRNAQF